MANLAQKVVPCVVPYSFDRPGYTHCYSEQDLKWKQIIHNCNMYQMSSLQEFYITIFTEISMTFSDVRSFDLLT